MNNYAKILGLYLILSAIVPLISSLFETNWVMVFNSLSVGPAPAIVTNYSTLDYVFIILILPYYALSYIFMLFANAYLGSFSMGVNYLFSSILPALIVLAAGLFVLVKYAYGGAHGKR